MPLTLLDRESLVPSPWPAFAQCHASTLVLLPDGDLLAAYFAGRKEGSGDTAIWLSHRHQGQWLAPRRLMAQDGLAHWNPVLHYQQGRLWLFYKTGSDVHRWITRFAVSDDGGRQWSAPRELAPGEARPRGPVKNKLLAASDGGWLAPGSMEGRRYWDAFVDRSTDQGRHWQLAPVPLNHQSGEPASGEALWRGLADNALWESDMDTVFQWDGIIQPALWESAPGRIHLLARSTRGRLWRSDSADYGRSWCAAYPTEVPNNNSGIDLTRAASGTLVLACNPVGDNWGKRTPLSLYESRDNGDNWRPALDIEQQDGEFSYPAVIADGDRLHLTYTWNRNNIIYCALRLT
ncbi:sialidase family protein [Martelella alba]|uniref:Sialidase domain-containing protein n=1 Tax=Martelella alba TaxID=2590451 RepID=A0ABY2SHS5_9HYPH|nr:exo-alpha-sialidase [Martelella alba]TKI04676.1 hypothetical protein FCN80_17080 [Martelella alba]